MKALQIQRPGTFTRVETNPPVLDSQGLVAVRLHFAMICGSDLPFFTGDQYRMHYPLDPGMCIHECSGVVVESTSPRFNPGDRVVAMPMADRGLCEVFIARDSEAVLLPESLDDMELAVLVQPLSTVLFGLDKLGSVEKAHVDVLGAGPIGLLTCWALRRRGAGRIRAVDPVRSRCLLAERLGAHESFWGTSTEMRAVKRSGGMEGPDPDVCVEAVGHQQKTINDAIFLVKEGGVVLALGVPETPVYALEYELFFRKNLRLIGSVTPDWAPYLQEATDMVARWGEDLRPMITHRFPMDRAAEAFRLAVSRNEGVGKVVLDARDWKAGEDTG